MNLKEVNYKGTDIEEIYKLALIGADFATEKNENGVTLVNTLSKELYAKTVLLARFLKVVDLPENRVLSIEQYKNNICSVEDFSGKNANKLRADYNLFVSMLDEEINNCITKENDVTIRIHEMMAVDLSPENLEIMQKNSKEFTSQLKKITKLVEKADTAKAKE